MHFRRLALLTLAATVACGGTPPPAGDAGPSVSRVDPSAPTGTVWGSVIHAGTQMPLADVGVSLAIAGAAQTVQTDADGNFTFTDVPVGGEAAVTLTKEGYSRATLRFQIPGETGNFPAEGIGAYVGPVALFALTGTVTVQVIGRDGRLLNGVQGEAMARPSFVDLGSGGGSMAFVVSQDLSSDGVLQFVGLPDLNALANWNASITVIVNPIDVNGDGIYDWIGKSESRSAAWLVTHGGRFTMTLDPAGEASALHPIASNVGSIFNGGIPKAGDSVVQPGEPVRVVFNQPVRADSIISAIFKDDGKEVVPSTATVQSGNVVLIAPAQNQQLLPGREYHVLLEVLAQGTTHGGSRSRLYGSFFLPVAAGTEVRVASYKMVDKNANSILDAGDDVEFELNQVIGLGDGLVAPQLWFPGYFNRDLDQSGPVPGDAHGEWNSNDPFHVVSNEPVPPAPFARSGFTRHFKFTMPYVQPVAGSLPYQFQPNSGLDYMLNLDGTEAGYRRLIQPGGAPVILVQGRFDVALTLP